MNLKFLSKIALTTSLILLGSSTLAFADGTSNCQVIYGGGEVCPPSVQFTINKMVQAPTKGGQYVNNLSSTDGVFSPGQNVNFQIAVQNTGTQSDALTVTDVLPSYLNYVSGGSYDSSNRTITNTITLNPGASQTYQIVTQVVSSSQLPSGQTCNVTNVGRATDANGGSAESDSQFCIQNTAPVVQPQVPTKSIPNTGPEDILYVILPSLGAAGLYLRRKAGL